MLRLAKARTLDSRRKKWLRTIRELVLRYAPDATLILYGSAARGVRTSESDYDMIVLTPQPLHRNIRDELRAAIYDMELMYGVVLSVLFLAHADCEQLQGIQHPFWQNISRDGIEIE